MLLTVPRLSGATAFVLFLLAALTGYLNFARWDNMETFLPAIWYAHSELLRGRFPLWNPLQNLGEPLHALGIGAVLYPPYTIAVALTKVLHWPEARALDVIAVTHATFAAAGISKLLLELRVRPALSFCAALATVFCGYALVVGAIWVHMLPNLAWSIWAMWGFRRVLAGERAASGIIASTISLAAVLYTGHVQTGALVWLAVCTWALGLAVATGVLRKHALTLIGIVIAAALLAAPSVLPTALIVADASRMQGSMTPGLGFRPLAMLGLLLPTIGASDGALVHPVLVTTFAGSWVLPGIVLGAGVLLHRRTSDNAYLLRVFLVTLLTALLCLWLNFGPKAGLYSALHALPVFSRFRVPYKYFERAVPLLVMAAAMGLQLAERREPPRPYAWTILLLTVVAAAAWIIKPAHEPLVLLAGVSSLLVLLCTAILPPSSVPRLLVPLTIVQCIAVLGIAQAPNRSKSYWFDRGRSAAPPLVNIESRVLPLSEGPANHPYTRPLALFYAPTLDGYASASGHRFALTSTRLGNVFPASVSGVPWRRVPLPVLLNSNFLNLADVGYLIVALGDTAVQNTAQRIFPQATVTTTPQSLIFDLGRRAPRAFFATEQRPGNAANRQQVLFGEAPLYAVTVEGDSSRRTLPAAELTELKWGRSAIGAQVHAPEGGLLVFSTAYSREWEVKVDGVSQKVVPVDEIFAGVWVPAGAQTVSLRVRRWPILAGFGIAVLGAMICVALCRKERAMRDTAGAGS